MLVIDILFKIKATFKGMFANVPTNNKLPQKKQKKTNGLKNFNSRNSSVICFTITVPVHHLTRN